ncbi:MAG: DUF367 family protein [Thermoplasmataceae archaeon]
MFPHIFFIYLHQDDPKKSTMKKLERFELARRIDRPKALRSVVLTFSSEKYLLPADRNLVGEKGITVIEGSWKRNELMQDITFRHGRKLPPLLASNPVNYGKWDILSSVEAVTASLIITGYRETALELISKFTWGHTFLSLNQDLLNEYSRCKSLDEMQKVVDSIA